MIYAFALLVVFLFLLSIHAEMSSYTTLVVLFAIALIIGEIIEKAGRRAHEIALKKLEYQDAEEKTDPG